MRLFGHTISFARSKPPVEDEQMLAVINGALASFLKAAPQYYSDDVTRRKQYSVYKTMQGDPKVKSTLDQLIGLILGDGWDVQAADVGEDGPTDEAQKQADFVRYCFDNCSGSFADNLVDLCDAHAMGFAVLEILWKIEEGGDWPGLYSVSALKSKDPEYISFDLDEYANVTALRQQLGTGQDTYSPESFIVYSNRSPYGIPWGQSDLMAAYGPWFVKDVTKRLYLVWLQRCASGTPMGKYPTGATKKAQDDLLAVLKRLQQETALVIPDNVQIEMLQAAGGSDAAFTNALAWCDEQIAQAILGVTLTSSEGDRTGSMALGNVHLSVLQNRLRILRERLCETLNDQLVRRIVDYNFATRLYPRIVIVPPTQETTVEWVDAIFKATNLGITVVGPDDVQDIRDRLGLTAAPPEQEEPMDLSGVLGGLTQQPQQSEPADGSADDGAGTPDETAQSL